METQDLAVVLQESYPHDAGEIIELSRREPVTPRHRPDYALDGAQVPDE